MERDSAQGAIQPGLKNLKKSHVIETQFQPRLESRKQDGCRYQVEAVSVG